VEIYYADKLVLIVHEANSKLHSKGEKQGASSPMQYIRGPSRHRRCDLYPGNDLEGIL